MQINLKRENGSRFYYSNRSLEPIINELNSFLEFDKSMDSYIFAKKMMYSHELKSNNQVEGLKDDLETIENIISKKTIGIKNAGERQRILNLYHGYYYILHHKKQDKEHLMQLYQILSKNLLTPWDLRNMGPYYRKKPVYILQNGRLDMVLEEGVAVDMIDELMDIYFAYLNSTDTNDKINEYIKSQIMHFYFVYIHPYFDVNGRTSRTMSMWYLLKKQAYPYIIFNRGISFIASFYDNSIKRAKHSGNLTDFLNMMLITLKKELEKEHVMQEVLSNTEYNLNSTYYQAILYYLTIRGNVTLRDFALMYNRFNDKKSIREIYEEMIKPLIDAGVFVVTRYTKRSVGDIPNMEFVLNPSRFDCEDPHLIRIKKTIV